MSPNMQAIKDSHVGLVSKSRVIWNGTDGTAENAKKVLSSKDNRRITARLNKANVLKKNGHKLPALYR